MKVRALHRFLPIVSLVGSMITVFTFSTGIMTFAQLIDIAPAYWVTRFVIMLSSILGKAVTGILIGLLKFVLIVSIGLLPPGLVLFVGMALWDVWERNRLSHFIGQPRDSAQRQNLESQGMTWFMISVGIAISVSIAFSVLAVIYLNTNASILKLVE